MGKNLTVKTPPGDFQVTTPETPPLSRQAVTSKGIPSTLPTYSWTFTQIQKQCVFEHWYLSDIEPEDDFDNEDDGILNAFTATLNPTEGIIEDEDEEEDLVESKFETMDE